MEPLTERVIRDAMSALGVYRKQPKVHVPNYDIRQDDLFQNRLDELERIEALEYAAEDARWAEKQCEPEPEWEFVHYKIDREKALRVQTREVSESEIRERVSFLQKRMRRNGAVQSKLEFEKELRELQKQLKSAETSGVFEDTKHWD